MITSRNIFFFFLKLKKEPHPPFARALASVKESDTKVWVRYPALLDKSFID